MNLLKTTLVLSVLIAFACTATFHLSSCTKHVADHDTVTVRDTVTIRDTTTIRDTITIRDTVCPSGLIAYYTFSGGSLHDGSGNNNDIVFNNATPTSDRFGNPNSAYLFDGHSSYMEVANSASLNPSNITLMAIVKINGFNTGSCHANQIVGKGYPDYDNGFYVLRFADVGTCDPTVDSAHEYFSGSYGDNNPQGTASAAEPDSITAKKGVWYNLIYTYDGQTSNFYVNGILKDSRQKSAAFTPNIFNLSIGKHNDPNFPYYFNGVIDEVRIYKRAISQAEVTKLNNLTN